MGLRTRLHNTVQRYRYHRHCYGYELQPLIVSPPTHHHPPPSPSPILSAYWVTLLLLIAWALLFTAYQHMGCVGVVVGARDGRFLAGMHEREVLDNTGQLMRWTTNHATVTLPVPATFTPLIYSINIINRYPHTLADHPDVQLVLQNGCILTVAPPRESRHYQLLIPPHNHFTWGVPIDIYSTTMMTPADARDLGVVFVSAKLAPTGQLALIPPVWQMVAYAISIGGFYTLLRGIGASPVIAWGSSILFAIIWAFIVARFPMDILPYTMRLAGVWSLGALYGIAVTRLKDDASWVSIATLPVLMGIAYWLMPVYQLMMTLDGVRGVTPYPPTMWIAAAGGVTLVVGVIPLAATHRLHYWRHLVVGVFALAAIARLIVMLEFVMANSGVATITLIAGLSVVVASVLLRWWQTALVAIVALAAVIALGMLFDPWQGRAGPDFWILFKGAREWYRGGSLYNIPGIIENHYGHSFKVPPFYGMLFLPFVEQDGLTILFWHRILNMTLVSATMLIMVQWFDIHLFSFQGAGLLLIYAMRPLADTVAYGQIDIVLLLLLTLALAASQRGYDEWAGAAVALTTLFKLYPALILVFFLVKRQWRGIIGFAIAMLICNITAIIVIGWDMHMVYLLEVIPRIRGGTAWVENQTFNGFFSRLFAPDISATIFNHPVAMILTYAMFGITTLVAAWFAWHPTPRTSPYYMLQFGMFVILLVLSVPAAWMHYETITIVTFAALLVYAREEGLPRWSAALLALAYALIAYGNQWSFYLNKVMSGLTVMGVSYKFYGLLLLLAVVIGCLREQHADAVV